MENKKLEEIKNLPWESLRYTDWKGLEEHYSRSFVYVLESSDLRTEINKKLKKISDYYNVAIAELEELFWEKNNKVGHIRDSDFSLEWSLSKEPFKKVLEKIHFPKLKENIIY